MKRYSAVILGLGNIGFGYDAKAPAGRVLTHARAFSRHPGFRLAAGVDPSARARSAFTRATGVPAFARLEDAGLERCDVVVVAVPTAFHLEAVRQAVLLRPRLIVLEKPVAGNLRDALRIRALLARRKIPCCVNYMRRADPGFIALAGLIARGRFGALRSGRCVYGKGLLNGGSHYVDLLAFLLGPGTVRAAAAGLGPYGADDPQPAFTLRYGRADVAFTPVDWRRRHVGEAELVFEERRVRLEDFCGEIRLEPALPGLRTDMKRYQLHVTSRLHAFLSRAAALPSTLGSGLATLRVCDAAARRARRPS